MTATVLTALGGAGGLAALITPLLLSMTARRQAVQQQNEHLIEQLQEERNRADAKVEARDATIVSLWDYVYTLRWWMVKGSAGDPPTLPDSLSVAEVRARAAVDR